MATVGEAEVEVGFEEGMLWLPSYVLDEACDTKLYMRNRHQNHDQKMHEQEQRHHKSHREPPSHSQYPKYTFRSSYQRPKLANGGPRSGMQAIFLVSGQRSCGTGVYLPQRAGTNFQPRKKPACAPVLIPARVVQALNLNVHALGVEISPPQVHKDKLRCGEVYNNNSSTKKRSDDEKDHKSKQFSVISQNRSSSPEIFLPKEWTY